MRPGVGDMTSGARNTEPVVRNTRAGVRNIRAMRQEHE
jgi:hypothetical protein